MDRKNELSQFHHTFHLQVLIALGTMGGEIDGGLVLDELTYTVKGLAGSLDILEDDAEFVGLQGDVAIGHITVEHIEEPVVLGYDDAVSFSVTLGLDKPDAISYLLRIREVLERFAILGSDDVITLQFHLVVILGRYIYLGIGKVFQCRSMVWVFVGDEDFCHLLWLVACG